MFQLHQFAFYLHVSVGTCALLVFWIPMFTRKGSLDHRRFGRYFAMAMYVVSLSGLVMASMDLLSPALGHGSMAGLSASERAAIVVEVREGAVFLWSLSILVLATTRHGWLVILQRDRREGLRTPVHVGLCSALVLVGAGLLVLGMMTGSALYLGFAVLEMLVGAGALRYIFKPVLSPREWWIEHLGSLIGSGIGAYTAFFVFGGSRLLAQLISGPFEGWSLLFWFGPGVIGGVATAILSRQYRNRFAPAASPDLR